MVFAVGLLGLLVVGICCYCVCYRKCCKKKKKEEKKAIKEKVDLKAVQMLAASYQEKVQPSVDELDYNSDEFQSDGSSGVKIGTVRPVYNGPVYSSQPVYHGHRTTSQKSCLIFTVKWTCI